jgi:hypothetical protein
MTTLGLLACNTGLESGQLLFQVISSAYERQAIIDRIVHYGQMMHPRPPQKRMMLLPLGQMC